MTFFDMLRNLFFTRKDTSNTLDTESQTHFVPFLLNRWLSFYGKEQCIIDNETLNKYTGLFEDKNDLYKLYFNFLPKLKFKKIEYIKKKKVDELDQKTLDVSLIAKHNNISKREISLYLDLYNKVYK
jgi:hypothetical protein